MADRSDVCVLIPTYNEAATIGSVVGGFHEQGFENVLVVDGHSTDGTQQAAREFGARVVEQSGRGQGRGKGQAVREGLAYIEAPYVLMVDGDGTYRPADANRLLEPVLSGTAEHAIGDRYADMDTDAMSRLNGVGNRLINRAFSYVHGRDLRDVLSGYRAFTLESARRCTFSANGFGIETELSVECMKHGVRTAVVPISYQSRPDGSETNLRPVRDGSKILVTLYRLAKTHNPLFYFGSVGVFSTVFGAAVGAYVGIEYFTRGISHEALAVVAAFGILFGVQLLMFGVLSDMIVTINREQTRRFEEIAGHPSRDASLEREPAAVGGADAADRPTDRSPTADIDVEAASDGGTAREYDDIDNTDSYSKF